MRRYLLTLLEEKGISLETPIEVESLHTGTPNHMTVGTVVEFMLVKPLSTQKVLRKKLMLIDYRNGDIMDFFLYLARFMAVNFPASASIPQS